LHHDENGNNIRVVCVAMAAVNPTDARRRRLCEHGVGEC
jgi:hypothetical protein